MRVILGLALALVLSATGRAADNPPPSEDEIEAKLKAVRKQVEALKQQEESLQKQLAEAKTRPVGGIKAEVRGILRWDDKHGHYILTRDADSRETRVWLRYTEDKVTVRKLDGLLGTEVIATGPLKQLPPNVTTSVPPGGIYLEGFSVEEAPVKDPK